MQNEITPGKMMTYTAGSAVSVGRPVVLNTRIGVAATDIAAGAKGALAMEGVYELPKVAALAISQGELVYWCPTADPVSGTAGTGAINKTASGNTLAGYAFASALAGDAVVQVKINA